MTERHQWSKFYWADWSQDGALRACSFAAKGLWMDLLCQMHVSPERGYLIVGGKPATAAQIARIVGGDRRTIERLIHELEANGVASRDERGALFSRRMVREIGISRKSRNNGRMGGNPLLNKLNELDKKWVNPQDTEAEADTETERKRVPPVGPPAEAARHIEAPESTAPATPAPAPKSANGSRLPADWQPSPEGEEFCRSYRLPLAATVAQFRDHWLAKPGAAGRKLDWDATWRNWCRSDRRAVAPRDQNSKAETVPPGTVLDAKGRVVDWETLPMAGAL